ncbi:MAG TPA: helix-turn-helix domain-containing protein [Gemmatimonadales bacterium]|nr:helix-turn-helix domain-containing protein [Gemmatimonadales bacterium]
MSAPEITAAADRLLARYGYRRMTVDDIAREADIGKGTIYLHFPSKEAVILSVINRHIEATLQVLRQIAGGPGPAAERLADMLVARVLERFDRFLPYRESLHEMLAAIRPALLAQRESQLRQEARIFGRVIEELGGPPGAARMLLAATNSYLPYYLSAEELGSRARLRREVSELARLLVAGLSAVPSAAQVPAEAS